MRLSTITNRADVFWNGRPITDMTRDALEDALVSLAEMSEEERHEALVYCKSDKLFRDA
jgi:hypothetical protein